jgi:hypothetical protein
VGGAEVAAGDRRADRRRRHGLAVDEEWRAGLHLEAELRAEFGGTLGRAFAVLAERRVVAEQQAARAQRTPEARSANSRAGMFCRRGSNVSSTSRCTPARRSRRSRCGTLTSSGGACPCSTWSGWLANVITVGMQPAPTTSRAAGAAAAGGRGARRRRRRPRRPSGSAGSRRRSRRGRAPAGRPGLRSGARAAGGEVFGGGGHTGRNCSSSSSSFVFTRSFSPAVRRSTNTTPSRWSSSCWMIRASQPSAFMACSAPARSW